MSAEQLPHRSAYPYLWLFQPEEGGNGRSYIKLHHAFVKLSDPHSVYPCSSGPAPINIEAQLMALDEGNHPIKYYIREQDKKGFDQETHDYPLFRYAEVLLNYAEAAAFLQTFDRLRAADAELASAVLLVVEIILPE